MLDVSTNIPFPTGNDLKVVAYDTDEGYTNVNDRKPLITDNVHYKALLDEYNRKLNLSEDYKKSLQTNPDLEREALEYEKQALIHYAALLDDINEQDGAIYFDNSEDSHDEFAVKLIKRINRHNNYIKRSGDKVAEGAIKNYIVNSLYSIASDAANWLEAHTGVDVATGPLKAIASQSELSEV
jgi:hypothetical protein